jgi:hypothetical protein
MEKAVLTREQAEVLEKVREARSDETITDMCIKRAFVGIQEPLNGIHPYILVKCLVNGYTIKRTPEEEILEMHKNAYMLRKAHEKDSYEQGMADGTIDAIESVLRILNMRIKGINTDDE